MKFENSMQATFKKLVSTLAVTAALGVASPAHALLITLTDTGNATANAGFRTAANFWESKFFDNVTVNITSGFAALDTDVIGSTGSADVFTNYSAMKAGLTADAKGANDAKMVAGLPGGSSYSKLINGTSESTDLYGGASYKQNGVTDVSMTRANAKAIGLVDANDAVEDAQITFSSAFNFDFDSSDGIAVGFMDFVGVAIHEIGHALGFTSGVDVLDYYYQYAYYYGDFYSDKDYAPFTTVLDFTRCSARSEALGADMDWRIGINAKDFAIDGSCSGTELVSNAWSTGSYFGDGRQASHWKDNLGLGIMDPTFAFGELGVVSALDLLAFDVIGWDLQRSSVPEPASIFLVSAALAGLVATRRRKTTV